MKISVVINTYNAEANLAQVLERLTDFDEVVVCDMESTDSTTEIALKYGCKVVSFPKKNNNICEVARDFAIHSASYEWVLVVDADELVTPELKQFLYAKIREDNCPDGLYIPRKNYLFGVFTKSSYPDAQLRFFRKDKTYWPPIIHSVPKIDGTVERISPSRMELALVHLSDTLRNHVRRLNDYTDYEVEKRQIKSVSFAKLIFKPAFHFFKLYILKGGIRYGKVGLIQACKGSFGKFLIYAKAQEKIWEQDNNIKS